MLIVVGCSTLFDGFGLGSDRATRDGCALAVDYVDAAQDAAIEIERDLELDGTYREDDFIEVEEHYFDLDELAMDGRGDAARVADERADATNEFLTAVEDNDLVWASESLDWMEETYHPLLDACEPHL
ncbi:hypothetical protein RIF23_02740 [Lipingzhangella sp. LS1_29]|uniref:Uncharacterized protein n=1 Tax=Lipingzhangella rawalii TaxID=2055835 RepID=A0ABU2H326_9ACTN|nr:hypothetical protein [Lipingzhangella rawalii]